MLRKTLLTATTVLALSAGLAACTATTEGVKAPSPSPTSTSTPEAATLPDKPGAAYLPETKIAATCEGGESVIDAANADITLEGDCSKVTITENAGWSIVHLNGSVGELVVDSSVTGVYGNAVTAVTVSGESNDITYTGTAPTVDDSGKNNRVSQL